MTWLVPSALMIAGLAIVAAAAVHFIARSRPLAEPLPTARFIPDRAIRARTRSFAFSDISLLLLRAAAIAAIGAAIAGPMFFSAHGRVSRIVLVDRSRAVANAAELRDSVRSTARTGDVIVVFDSTAARSRLTDLDSLRPTSVRGSLSVGLVASIRAVASLERRSDSLALVIISPLTHEEIDAATLRIRRAWPGVARVVRLTPAVRATESPAVRISFSGDDAVAAGLSLAGYVRTPENVRVVRGSMSPADSQWARDGHPVVHWPAAENDVSWPARSSIDAAGAAMSATGIVVGRFPRVWLLDGTPIARWADGEPAAVERRMGSGCVRDVAILIDPASDLTLGAPFREFSQALIALCGGPIDATPADSTVIAALSGLGPAPASSRQPTSSDISPWTPWLLTLGALLLIAELALRRGVTRTA